ncbi:sigma 54-interacting transcriptional regulator [Vitiosangium sp. GDMCC 1.1324]|uniref:sigma-54-dependent Fis family transcriptional regulator n=1 Tax=Vitiosangium sp. (strain GDMCC 1.1324) TaxID=2138576 RepID=UPI000D347BFD|nr:sigma 54-interacting transcriptional regulator [Vitiosangium sp. GDMCC 1.1324]PTL83064.1 AAA family ATPase [Vitiosangium sp. GDMCC 1.1324]
MTSEDEASGGVEGQERPSPSSRPSRRRTHQAVPASGPQEEDPAIDTRNERLRREPRAREAAEVGRNWEAAPYREPKALLVQREGIEDLTVPLYPDRSYVFGRAPECTVVFPHDAVSRQHGRLSFREDHRWVFRDLNSKNGSFMGREEEQAPVDARLHFQRVGPSRDWVLEVGDVVLLGNSKSRITLLAEVPLGLGVGPRAKQETSPVTTRLERSIDRCARHYLPVFLRGDSGTGKTFIAREIHSRGGLEGNFVILNCGRLPQDPAALQSELLGHVKGAYTGASIARVGKLYSANGGTLFLDEVEFLPRIAQDFLIDVLEGTGSLAPLGAPADFREPPPRFRLISASKVPLRQTALRPDLAQRLAAGDFIILPTLEERSEDIPHLVEVFLHRLKVEQQYDAELTRDAIAFLQRSSWPGQIRELESTVKTVVAREAAQQELEGLERQRTLVTLEAVKSYLEQRELGFGGAVPTTPARISPLSEEPPPVVRKRPSDLTELDIRGALEKHQGNKTRASVSLGVALNTLKARMKVLGIE